MDLARQSVFAAKSAGVVPPRHAVRADEHALVPHEAHHLTLLYLVHNDPNHTRDQQD